MSACLCTCCQAANTVTIPNLSVSSACPAGRLAAAIAQAAVAALALAAPAHPTTSDAAAFALVPCQWFSPGTLPSRHRKAPCSRQETAHATIPGASCASCEVHCEQFPSQSPAASKMILSDNPPSNT
eukprot:1526879-Amphidinium_carterae.1